MRSLLWTGVFCLLILELGLTLILVIPLPHKLRNWICVQVSKLDLKKKLRMPLMGVFFALVFALMDTTNFLAQIYTTKDDLSLAGGAGNGIQSSIDRHLTKEKEYKAGRNMYLVGFALTLLFVIGRITELMQEHAVLSGKIENLKIAVAIVEADAAKATKSRTNVNESAAGDNDVPTEGIEMKPMGLKKKD